MQTQYTDWIFKRVALLWTFSSYNLLFACHITNTGCVPQHKTALFKTIKHVSYAGKIFLNMKNLRVKS